ncbi:hypothetical protein [Mesorhizobium sp. WSM4906]|uniref:hypothetical protein n=1 Tax=Mesorhizobium sp. WSM4906 TaxID=3038546 RepID=UPI002416A65E|nr:hypothetical protein [Mesorhizobium sp. WSM4906]WFP76353.1 hypothetical protein QAZ22_00430 [Mesorhizobium sp. WSM4906]
MALLLEGLGPEAAARVAAAALQPEVIMAAQPPEYWSARFAARGLRMSPRWLREKVLKAGLCYHVDKRVLISPKQLDELFLWRKSSRERDDPTAPAKPSKAYKRALAALQARKNASKKRPT